MIKEIEENSEFKTDTKSTGGASLSSRVASHEKKINIIWILLVVLGLGIVLNIVLLSINLIRENSFHIRITDMEKDSTDYRIELLQKIDNYQIEQLDKTKEQDDVLNCLKFKKYWQYEECFK